ncbi:MAG: ABC transporter ATP-binding protein [Pseudomonadota bacterium]
MTVQIHIQDLDFAIDNKPILQGLNLKCDVRRVGVIGQNGSGKSTLARLVAGLATPTSGTIRLGDLDPYKDRRTALREVGILFQSPEHQIIFPTVIEEITFGLVQLGNDKPAALAAAREILERFGLVHWEEAYVNTLSHGQKHLLCLMSVAAMKPKLLVLDEPFAGLDLPTKIQMTRYLQLYDGALLHISHDPDDLREYDMIVWMEEGRVKKMGAEVEILKAYQTAMHDRGMRDDLADLAS